MADIDAQRLAQYRRDGFIIVEGLLDDVTRRRMKQVLAELIEGARAVSTHDDVYDLEPTHSAVQPRVRRIKKPHLVHPVFAEFMRSPRLLAVLSALLGPSGVRLHGSKLNLKAPEIGSPVEWHQDWAFYPHTNDDLLAVGVLLDDATEQNGPMMVLPGSHRGPTFDHHGVRRPLLRRHGAGARRARLPACQGPDRARQGPARSTTCARCTARRRTPRRIRATCCSTSLRRPMPSRCSASPTGTSSTHRLLVGEPTVVPRTVDCPIRMPLPPAANQGSIYENQTALQRRYFEPAPVAVPRQST